MDAIRHAFITLLCTMARSSSPVMQRSRIALTETASAVVGLVAAHGNASERARHATAIPAVLRAQLVGLKIVDENNVVLFNDGDTSSGMTTIVVRDTGGDDADAQQPLAKMSTLHRLIRTALGSRAYSIVSSTTESIIQNTKDDPDVNWLRDNLPREILGVIVKIMVDLAYDGLASTESRAPWVLALHSFALTDQQNRDALLSARNTRMREMRPTDPLVFGRLVSYRCFVRDYITAKAATGEPAERAHWASELPMATEQLWRLTVPRLRPADGDISPSSRPLWAYTERALDYQWTLVTLAASINNVALTAALWADIFFKCETAEDRRGRVARYFPFDLGSSEYVYAISRHGSLNLLQHFFAIVRDVLGSGTAQHNILVELYALFVAGRLVFGSSREIGDCLDPANVVDGVGPTRAIVQQVLRVFAATHPLDTAAGGGGFNTIVEVSDAIARAKLRMDLVHAGLEPQADRAGIVEGSSLFFVHIANSNADMLRLWGRAINTPGAIERCRDVETLTLVLGTVRTWSDDRRHLYDFLACWHRRNPGVNLNLVLDARQWTELLDALLAIIGTNNVTIRLSALLWHLVIDIDATGEPFFVYPNERFVAEYEHDFLAGDYFDAVARRHTSNSIWILRYLLKSRHSLVQHEPQVSSWQLVNNYEAIGPFFSQMMRILTVDEFIALINDIGYPWDYVKNHVVRAPTTPRHAKILERVLLTWTTEELDLLLPSVKNERDRTTESAAHLDHFSKIIDGIDAKIAYLQRQRARLSRGR